LKIYLTEPLQTGRTMTENLNLESLEKYIDIYPWYSAGYIELYNRLSNSAISNELVSKAAPRIFSRQALYEIYIEKNGTVPSIVEIRSDTPQDEIIDIHIEKESEPKLILIGGDYFSRKDFEQIQLDRNQPIDKFIEDKPSLLRSATDNKNYENNPEKSTEPNSDTAFDDSEFYTETLAIIYAEQGYYKRALEIYAKLILLYPEKSSYFASLVKDLKSKHNL